MTPDAKIVKRAVGYFDELARKGVEYGTELSIGMLRHGPFAEMIFVTLLTFLGGRIRVTVETSSMGLIDRLCNRIGQRGRGAAHDGGTGLGLTLVAHIATAHGGRVEVESTPGAGSTFCMFLPIESKLSVGAKR